MADTRSPKETMQTLADDITVGRYDDLILPWFRGHPQARFELEVFDGSASNRNEATFLHGRL